MAVCHQNENLTADTAVARDKGKGVLGTLELGNVLRPNNGNRENTKDPDKGHSVEQAEESCQTSGSRKGFAPSRSELEKQYGEAQRKRITEARKRNEKSCYEAIHNPQIITPKPRELTVPVEFNLSCSNTPARSRCTTPARSRCSTPSRCNTPARSDCSDMSIDSTIRGRRGRLSSSKELTTPRAPNLRTAQRPRSLSRPRFDVTDLDVSAWPRTLRSQSCASSRAGSRQASASPARSTSSRNSCMITPRPRGKRTPCHNDSIDSISSDMAISVPGSVRSRMGRSVDSRASSRMGRSVDSRASNVSKRLSTDELEDLRIACKRQEQKELRRQNERRGRKAIKYPELFANNRSVSPLTVPKEFSLSCPATPARSVISDADSDSGDKNWEYSLRSVPASPLRTWEPELTIPNGPNLETAGRARSTSSLRRGITGHRNRSSSRNRFPREQEAIERHMERVSCAKWEHSGLKISLKRADTENTTSVNKQVSDDIARPKDDAQASNACKSTERHIDLQIPPDMDLDEWVKSATCAEERAQRRRQVEDLRHKKQSDEKLAKLKVFKGPMLSQKRAHASGVASKSQLPNDRESHAIEGN